jgi:hypothetical protein
MPRGILHDERPDGPPIAIQFVDAVETDDAAEPLEQWYAVHSHNDDEKGFLLSDFLADASILRAWVEHIGKHTVICQCSLEVADDGTAPLCCFAPLIAQHILHLTE